MFDNVHVQRIDWQNEHGTYRRRGVQRLLPIASTSGNLLDRWRRVGSVLEDIVGHAFEAREPLRPDGSRWSLSNIALPKKLALSLAIHDVLEEVPAGWRSSAYSAELGQTERVPMLISGSMKIHRINRFLTMRDLALPTSGASDGQTLAGATATGTHGAAIRLGAIHDTLRAIHLMVGPGEAVLVQPSDKPLKQLAARDLSHWLGFETRLVSDDDLFHAAQVHLGSMGLLLNAVVETDPLFYLTRVATPHTDDAWKAVLERTDPGSLPGHRSRPFHLEIILNPYAPVPSGEPQAWTISMRKERFSGQSGVDIRPGAAIPPNPDLVGIIADLGDLADLGLTNRLLRRRLTKELVARYKTDASTKKSLPGVMFGPTGLPRGHGESTELVIDAADAPKAVEVMLATLRREFRAGQQFLGGIGIRFVGGSDALLAPNVRPVSCFIELPGIRNDESAGIYAECGKALTSAGIPFGCHWGQHLVGLPGSLATWWGTDRVECWKAAREQLLSPEARRVFASPILRAAGLEG